jgi:uncharacterized protein
MPATLQHLSINADDVQRAKRFYEAVFDWTFHPWGPPDFFQASAGDTVVVALHGRRELKPGAKMLGAEATMAVEDIPATLGAVEASGGRIVMTPAHIETVGTLIWFEDTEANLVGAMRYEAGPGSRQVLDGPGDPAIFRHFAINADDVQRARAFYQAVFGWTFDPWGPPNFYQIKNAGHGFLGALQERRELKPGAKMLGLETSMSVPDIGRLNAAVEANGGRILMPPHYLQGVGKLGYFEDTEGNFLGAAQYDPGYGPGVFD